MVASLCLQWNYTQHLVDYSNICQISMLFISFFAKRWVVFVWNLRHCVPLVFLLKSVLIALKILPQTSKHYTSGPQEWLARPTVFVINTSGSQWKQCQLMLTKHSSFIPAEMWQLEFVQRVSRATIPWRFWASCLLNMESGGWWLFGQSTLLLWGWDTNGYLSLSVTNSKDHFNHVRFKCFHLRFWW